MYLIRERLFDVGDDFDIVDDDGRRLSRLSRAHVPSSAHRRNRSCAVFHGPYRSGMSRHGAPVRFTQQIPLSTCR